MSNTVANVLGGTLEETGVRQVFGLIGDSLNPLADAVRRSRTVVASDELPTCRISSWKRSEMWRWRRSAKPFSP